MFTGIIQTLGKIQSSENRNGDIRLIVSTVGFNKEVIEIGDSIACNGICLTVVEMTRSGEHRLLSFDVSKESLSKSLISSWQSNDQVNMELAMLPTTRFGGHIVSGHVDGLGKILSMEEDGRSWRITFRAQQDLAKYIATKGSITIDGISLTVNGVNGADFHVNIVPHTFDMTTLGQRKAGDEVHLEIDVVARYLERLLNHDSSDEKGVSLDTLSKNGYFNS